jgi:GNAT superfamily N-acetyltransferase
MPVRLAATDDIPALVRVINRAYVVEAHIFHGDRTDEVEVCERLERPNARFLVIDASAGAGNGTLAGAVFVEVCGERSYFGMLSVDPDWQGRGFARELIAAAEVRATAAGCAFMDIDVVDVRTECPRSTRVLVTRRPDLHRCSETAKVPVRMVRMTKALQHRLATEHDRAVRASAVRLAHAPSGLDGRANEPAVRRAITTARIQNPVERMSGMSETRNPSRPEDLAQRANEREQPSGW